MRSTSVDMESESNSQLILFESGRVDCDTGRGVAAEVRKRRKAEGRIQDLSRQGEEDKQGNSSQVVR